MKTLIDIKDLYAEDGGRPVFEGARLRLNAGERVFLTAPAASGKSTLVRLLAGLIRPGKGSISIYGNDLSTLNGEELDLLRSRAGFITKDTALISNLKALENVALPLLYHTRRDYDSLMEEAARLLDRTGFKGDLWGLPGGLSLKERREVSVARALSLEPDILICEGLWDGLPEAEKKNLSRVIVEYQKGSPERLLLFTADNGGGARLLEPHRVIRIENSRFMEDGKDDGDTGKRPQV